ncbi:hypothetical protein EBR96_08605 [bacterium]|nr:hypothetical protein [bacterium]
MLYAGLIGILSTFVVPAWWKIASAVRGISERFYTIQKTDFVADTISADVRFSRGFSASKNQLTVIGNNGFVTYTFSTPNIVRNTGTSQVILEGPISDWSILAEGNILKIRFSVDHQTIQFTTSKW